MKRILFTLITLCLAIGASAQKITVSGIVVDQTGERELDSYTYVVRSQSGIDIRKPMFNLLSQRGWPILGLEQTSMNLEDVFVRITDRDSRKTSNRR